MAKRAPTAAEKRHLEHVASLPCLDRFWSKVNRANVDECWAWLGTRSSRGYGQLWFNGKNRPATHLALELDGRPASVSAPYALHSCDNPNCVNPKHLRWGTPQENMDDRSARNRVASPLGEAHGSAKLTEAHVRAIRRDNRPHPAIAGEYSISASAVSRIKSGKRWGHVQ